MATSFSLEALVAKTCSVSSCKRMAAGLNPECCRRFGLSLVIKHTRFSWGDEYESLCNLFVCSFALIDSCGAELLIAVFFNLFAAAEPSTNVCVAHGTLSNDPSVYPTFCNKPDECRICVLWQFTI